MKSSIGASDGIESSTTQQWCEAHVSSPAPQGSPWACRLRELCRRVDEHYNSGLFHFHAEKDRAEHPDTLTPGRAIDDKPLKEIIRGLYFPDTPYEFSVLPADILGQVYEQFLGSASCLRGKRRSSMPSASSSATSAASTPTPTPSRSPSSRCSRLVRVDFHGSREVPTGTCHATLKAAGIR
jgi:hypothetical protein